MLVISGDDAIVLRKKFIEKFVDKQSSWYHALLKQVRESKGKHYYGCLWDSLFRDNLEVVGFDYARNYLNKTDCFFLFWDNHPESYLIYRNPDWHYPPNSLLALSASEWESMNDLLPEDCYIFDNTLTWAIALTHEESSPGYRICYFLKA